MACQRYVTEFAFIFFLFNASFYIFPLLGFKVEGGLSMVNDTEQVENAGAGDVISFIFNITLDVHSNNSDATIVYTGDSLEFPNVPSYRAVTWTLSSNGTDDDDDDDVAPSTFSNLVVEECVDSNTSTDTDNTTQGFCYNDTDNVDERMNFTNQRTSLILNMTTSLTNKLWSLTGTFDMQLRKNAVQGSLVRGILSIWMVENDTVVSVHSVVSDYVLIPLPDIGFDSPSSLVQPILGTFTTLVILNTTRDSLSATIGCLTPYENVSKEVMLTVQSMMALPYDTYGIHENTTDYLDLHGRGDLTSTIGSYQNNMAKLTLTQIPRYTVEYSKMELKSSFIVRVEDYSQLADGDVFPVLMYLRFHDNVIWVGEILISLDAPDFRKPSLTVTTAQTKQCPYDGRTAAFMTVLVAHDSSSTATAYNVTLNVYLPPYITMTSKTFSTPKENKITVVQEGPIINAEIARLTFSDPFKLTLELDLDLSDIQNLDAQNRIITAEALYNDRWGNLTDLQTDIAYTSLSIKKHCARRITWGNVGNCVVGACSCAPTGHSQNKCVPCGEMWRCKTFVDVPYFNKISWIENKGILCEASRRRRSSASVSSCYRQLSKPTRYMELSPRVAVITGQDTMTGKFYGIANNGAVYVMSEDDAVTWTSVTHDVYQSATSQSSYQWASFI